MELIAVEVAWVSATQQEVLALQVPAGTTLRQAVASSGLAERVADLDFARCAVGVYGVLKDWDEPAAAGDRIEVYRPLPVDPKAMRRRRL